MSIIKEDITFGRIAVLNNIISEQQLEEAVISQKQTDTLRPLGIILMEKGYITKDQLKTILEVQKKRMPKPATTPQERREDIVFAYLAVSRKYIDLETAYQCFQKQIDFVRKGLLFRISELLVNHRYLSVKVAEAILNIQEQRTVECPQCKIRYNTIGLGAQAEFSCKKCLGSLAVPADQRDDGEGRALEKFRQAMEEMAGRAKTEKRKIGDNSEKSKGSGFTEGVGDTKQEEDYEDDEGENVDGASGEDVEKSETEQDGEGGEDVEEKAEKFRERGGESG